MSEPIIKACKNCKFFRTRYQGVGDCARDIGQHSPFWVEPRDSGRLMVVEMFSCPEFTPVEAVGKDTL